MGVFEQIKKKVGLCRATLFRAVELEISSPCNLVCETCPNRDHRRPKSELPTEVIEKIIHELGDMKYDGTFSPHFYNEPLLDRRLPDILALVRHKVPRATINLFTNFTPMTPELYRKLLPNVDAFIVTTDQPEVARVVEKVTAELSGEELTKLNTRSLAGAGLSNRAGALDTRTDTPRRMVTCDFVNNMTIDASGDVHLCCNDYFSAATFGNVKERSLQDIWFDERYVKARNLGANAKHPLCNDCFWT